MIYSKWLALAALTVLPSMGLAASVIDNGTIQLGVDDYGQLNVPGSASAGGTTYVGLRYMPTNNDSTAPGCICEGWGVGIGDTGAFGAANNAVLGVQNLSLVSFASTASTATSVVDLGSSLRITHHFAPAAETPNLYRVNVTIENIGALAIADLRYTRTMDWDIEPTPFSEFVTHVGTATTTALLYSDDNGFIDPNPFATRGPIVGGTVNTDFADVGPSDHGSTFDFGFGALAAGSKYSFDIFYGAGRNTANALAALAAVGPELYSMGKPNNGAGGPNNDANVFVFAFKGVGGEVVVAPVPVPASVFLLAGAVGLLGAVRRRRSVAA